MKTNSKSEYRNPKQIQRFQIQMTETLPPFRWFVSDFGFRAFEFVSDFVLRVSCFGSMT